MKKLSLVSLILIFGFFSVYCAEKSEQQSNSAKLKKQVLVKKWETEKRLKTPESVFYDSDRNIIYVSNVNGSPLEKDGNGFISKVSLKGKIEILKWVTGLNAPKGLTVFNNKLYVSDIDHLIEIDIEKGKILNKYPAAGSEFLNDVTVDEAGNVYVSDMSAKNSVIYKFSKGAISIWLKSAEIKKPNGLYVENGKLIVGTSDLKAIDLSSKKITTIACLGRGIDGIAGDGKGNYFVSDWSGKTSLIRSDGNITELLNTTKSNINSADIEYIKSKKLLLIPTFFDNRVMAYEVSESF